MAGSQSPSEPVILTLPFRGTWQTRNSPARRVPSHGTHLFTTTYAVDFVPGEGRRSATVRDWRTVLAVEPPERFVGFGRPVLAPANGRVVTVHDGEVDHEARRSQAARVRGGAGAIAGNHVVVALSGQSGFVVIAHLRRGSTRVGEGERVAVGDVVGECGNSGNSTQPHVHVQVMDAADGARARGLPLAFRDYRVGRRGGPVLVRAASPRSPTSWSPCDGSASAPLLVARQVRGVRHDLVMAGAEVVPLLVGQGEPELPVLGEVPLGRAPRSRPARHGTRPGRGEWGDP
jgi:hypothetical protein